MTDDLSDKDWIRRAALEEIESLKLVRATLWEEHTHSFRWLMASLLAVNGAGLWAGFGADEISATIRVLSGGLFLVGMLAALLIAVTGQRSAQASFVPLNEYIGYWIGVAGDGERFEELEQAIQEKLEPATNIGKRSRILGWGSAITFVIGICVLAVGYLTIGVEAHSENAAIEALPSKEKELSVSESSALLPAADEIRVLDHND